MSSFLRVYVAAQYKVTLQISVFAILYLRHFFSPPLSSSSLLEKASFLIAILLLISLLHLASPEVMLPKSQNSVTCSIISPATTIFIAEYKEQKNVGLIPASPIKLTWPSTP